MNRGRAAVGIACLLLAGESLGRSEPITFNRDIAPIAFERCGSCHRPGMSAPFDLLTYTDFRKRGQQILDVTSRRIMPPWLPAPDRGEFAESRRLSDREIELIRNWVEEGMIEGDPKDLPPTPKWPQGWQGGQPEVVFEMAEPFVVPAEGRDVFRNIVISPAVTQARFVKSIELRASHPRLLHHAVFQVDRTGGARRLDQGDAETGFGGMSMAPSVKPDGHFIGWSPGRQVWSAAEGMAWRLEPGMDFVLQLHMLPGGKPEALKISLGFHFTDEAPTRHPMDLLLLTRQIDIPAGESAYVVETSYQLPVDVLAMSVYPHAHYLGKDLQAFAELPDGTTRWLIHIPDWDFSWQDEYRFAQPLELSRGSTVHMRYVFDNSAANVRNPNHPPQRVTYGMQSSDEMATFSLQVLPRQPSELAALRNDFGRHMVRKDIEDLQLALKANPHDPVNLVELGKRHLQLDEIDQAHGCFDRAVSLSPASNAARVHLAESLMLLGRPDEALQQAQAVLARDPANVEALVCLGSAHTLLKRNDQALTAFRQAVELNPDHILARYNLGTSLLAASQYGPAIEQLRAAVGLQPDHVKARVNLAVALSGQGQIDPAIQELREALAIARDVPEIHQQLGALLHRKRLWRESIEPWTQVTALRPELAEGWSALGLSLAMSKMASRAIGPLRKGLDMKPDQPVAANALAWILATHPDAVHRDGSLASKWVAETLAQASALSATYYDTSAAVRAELGDFDGAVEAARQAVTLTQPGPQLEQRRKRLELYQQRQPYRDLEADAGLTSVSVQSGK